MISIEIQLNYQDIMNARRSGSHHEPAFAWISPVGCQSHKKLNQWNQPTFWSSNNECWPECPNYTFTFLDQKQNLVHEMILLTSLNMWPLIVECTSFAYITTDAMNWLFESNNQACALHPCIFVLSFTQLNKLSLAKGYLLAFVFQALHKLPYHYTLRLNSVNQFKAYTLVLTCLYKWHKMWQSTILQSLTFLKQSINPHDCVHKLALPVIP